MSNEAFDPQAYAARLYERRDEAFDYEDDFTGYEGWKPTPQDCHANVDYLVNAVSGMSAVQGWLVADYGYEIGFMAHSIIRDSDGKNINVTPPAKQLPWRYLFLKDDDTYYWQAESHALSLFPQMLKCPASGRSNDEIRRISEKNDAESQRYFRRQD